MLRRLPSTTLFPYTTLFRSHERIALPRDLFGATRANSAGYDLANEQRLAILAKALVAHAHEPWQGQPLDRKSTRLNSSHVEISYAVFCLKKKKTIISYT